MSGYTNLLGEAWDFATLHPFVSAWLALATAWVVFTFASRNNA
jgi:hypothetical protein